MDWKQYKSVVAKSRELIVFPFFDSHMASFQGTGLDIGCGDGDLTSRVSRTANVKMVGVDLDEPSLAEARAIRSDDLHFVRGDIERNCIPNIGVTFDFAMSNCCLSHISEQGVYRVLTDLHSSLKAGAKLIVLVPNITWAKDQYSRVTNVPSGITAVPRYGGPQSFRLAQWYVSALERCGFEQVLHEKINIPDNDQLEPRYRERVGSTLFDAFVAVRAKEMPDIESLKKAFEVAHENRKLEIGLFWQRSLFFWGFVASALVGYGAAYGKSTILSTILALFGFVCSVVWASGNRGSKYWQEYWENKVNFYQHYTTGNIFYDRTPHYPRIFENYAPRRISVSKLAMALSDYMVFLWLVLCLITVGKQLLHIPDWAYEYGGVTMVLLTLLYCSAFLGNSESED